MNKLFSKMSRSRQFMLAMGALCLLGTLNVLSTTTYPSLNNYQTPFHYALIHISILLVGIFICWGLCRIDYHYWADPKILLLGWLVVIFLLILVKAVGIEVYGARRWLAVPIIGRFQPSELGKIVAMLMGAYGAAMVRIKEYPITLKNMREDTANWLKFTWPLWLILVFFVLVETQPDFGTAAIIMGVGLIQYFVGAKVSFLKFVKYCGPIIGAVGFAYYLYSPENFVYRINRLSVWWDPWSDSLDKGYQTVLSLMTIGSGGITGLSYGQGYSKFGQLPEAHTDFAVAIWGQEHGLIGITMLILVLFALLIILTKAAVETKDYLGKMILVGGTFLLVGQAIINMSMVAGILPVVGVPLPFVSYGGTSLGLNFIIVGILLSVMVREERREKLKQRKLKDQARRKADAEKQAALRSKLYKL